MNIYDVSKRAHVSIATVSRVLNKSDSVSDKTRKQVLAVMEELGYTPNVFARGLGLGTIKTIGIMCSDSSDPYLANATYCLERELRHHDYDSILCCTGHLLEDKKKYLELLLSKHVDAIILAGSQYIELEPEDNAYLLKAAEKLPLILVNGSLEGKNIYCTVSDDYAAIHRTAAALLASGRKRVLYLYSGNSYSTQNKLNGYRDAMRDFEIPEFPKLIHHCQKDISAVLTLLLTLHQSGLLFDSVLASEDILAVGAVKYAHAQKLRIPDDISIIGYNNSILSRCTDPEITSVDNKVETLCTTAVRTLMNVLSGSDAALFTVIPAELVERGTTDF